MKLTRSSGILLHITSLPGSNGIGDLDSANAFIDFLNDSGQRYWQMLPIGPTGYGDSPYQCLSSFAGNTLFIGRHFLNNRGLLSEAECSQFEMQSDTVDYGKVISLKQKMLETAFNNADAKTLEAVKSYQQKNKSWLDDFALYSAIKASEGGKPWTEWPEPLRKRDLKAIRGFSKSNESALDYVYFCQWCFATQWQEMKSYAKSKHIEIIGDLPIFVAHDSADTWANQALFKLNDDGQPTVVAGVPPDYFSKTGQLWGNPIYNWDMHKANGYTWWQQRISHLLKHVDVMRLDHFRGFVAHWEVPATDDTAMNGKWVDGPGADFFSAIADALGELPIIAEDLGKITKEVEQLKHQFNLPGMTILQFAFGTDPNAPKFVPHNYVEHCVAYPGTHDNDTTVGWWNSLPGADGMRTAEEIEAEKAATRRYFDFTDAPIHKIFINRLFASVAGMVIFPMQDLLGLGTEARMNRPSIATNNWTWRVEEDALKSSEYTQYLRQLSETYDRNDFATK